jgi:hypothetical protein
LASHEELPAAVEKTVETGLDDHPEEPALVPEVELAPDSPT